MTYYAVVPNDIAAFGDTLANEFGPRATTILNNAKNAELQHEDFGTILAQCFGDTWANHYNRLIDHLTSIDATILNASEAFHLTAQTYLATDESGKNQMAGIAEKLYREKGTTLDVKSAPKDAPADGSWRDVTNSYYAKPGERTDYGDRVRKAIPGFAGKLTQGITDLTGPGDVGVAQLVTDGLGIVQSFEADMASYIKDPFGFLISSGLGFLLKIFTPLKWSVDAVLTGNPDSLKASSSRLADVAKDLERLATDLIGAAQQGIPSWEGAAATAAAAKLEEFVKAIHGTAAVAGGTAGLLQMVALLSQALEDTVLGIVGDVVKWVVLDWIKALATAPVTAGASTAEATAETELAVAQGTERTADATAKATSIFSRVGQAFTRLSSKLLPKDAKGKFAKTLKDLEAPTLNKEITESGKRLIGRDGSRSGTTSKVQSYYTPVKTTVEDYGIGTDETDEEIDQQLDFGNPGTA